MPEIFTDELKARHEAEAAALLARDYGYRWESGRRIIYVEYHDKKSVHACTERTCYRPSSGRTPASVYTSQDGYDIDGMLIHNTNSGGGYLDPGELANPSDPPTCQVWAAPHCTLPGDATLRAHGFERLAEPLANPWEMDDAREVDGVAYCHVCEQQMPDDELCEHLFDTESGYAGPGADEMDPGGVKESFLAVMKASGIVEPLLKALETNTIDLTIYSSLWSQHCTLYLDAEWSVNYGPKLNHLFDEEYSDGLAWLQCIAHASTPKAKALTIEWLKELL